MVFQLHIESQENLRKPDHDVLVIPGPELTTRQLITLRVLAQTATLSEEEQRRAVDQALQAFERDLFLVTVNGKRLQGLAERLTLGPASAVRFWRLVPLAGG